MCENLPEFASISLYCRFGKLAMLLTGISFNGLFPPPLVAGSSAEPDELPCATITTTAANRCSQKLSFRAHVQNHPVGYL